MTQTEIAFPRFPIVSEDVVYQAVFENPIGSSYKASHRVQKFLGNGEPLIWKQPAIIAGLKNLYYAVQDCGFLRSRTFFASGKDQLRAEAEKLVHLAEHMPGLAPKLLHYDPKRGAIVREYIRGETFREMNSQKQEEAIGPIVDLVGRIHKSGVAIGDAHVKNVIRDDLAGGHKWLDFDGRFDAVPIRAMADDLLKLAYSSFTETGDILLAEEMAGELELYPDRDVKKVAAKRVEEMNWTPWLYFATRVSETEHKRIKEILMSSLS